MQLNGKLQKEVILWKINRLSDIHSDVVARYSGFLSCLVYSSAHQGFRETVLGNAQALNDWSGAPLLILVADEIPERYRIRRRSDLDTMHMMVTLSVENGTSDQSQLEIARHFGIKRSDLPCIIFFDGVEEPQTIVYKFLTTDNLIENLMGIFDDCEEAWVPPTNAAPDLNELRTYRRQMLERLNPALNRRKFLRLVSGLMRNPGFTGLLGNIPGMLTGVKAK